MKRFFEMLLRLTGWKIIGSLPQENKYVLIVAPHTSNWDFFIGMMARYAVGINLKFLIKSQAFVFPAGPILKALGGVPIDRSQAHGFVENAIRMFNENDYFVLGLTPEGTRSPVKKWKTGFYYIAKRVNVPIVMTGFDYQKKEIIIQEPFWPTDDINSDFEKIIGFFRTIHGRHKKEIPDFEKS